MVINRFFSLNVKRPREIPFTLPPRFMTQNQFDQKEAEEMELEGRRDILAHRGSLSVSSRSQPPPTTSLLQDMNLIPKLRRFSSLD